METEIPSRIRRPLRILLCAVVAAVSLLAAETGAVTRDAAAARLQTEAPDARVERRGDRIVRLYGTTLATGVTAADSAQSFRERLATVFGVAPSALRAASSADGAVVAQPVFYRPQRGDYKFTLFRYFQEHDGLPVDRAELRVLVRNETDHPVVWAASSLRDLEGFEIEPTLRDRFADPLFVTSVFERARTEALERIPTLRNFASPEIVVWAGTPDEPAPPRPALRFRGDDKGPAGAHRHNRQWYVDLESGELLYEESLIVDINVAGNASGVATTGLGADLCESESTQPMPYLQVASGAASAFADVDGDFVIADGGMTVEAGASGRWFEVVNWTGDEVLQTESSGFDLLFNETNSDETIRSQINGYIEANRVRDRVALWNAAYPTFTDSNIPVRVNRTDGFCPGNAWYDPSDAGSATGYSINFCLSSPTRANTAFGSVVHHEFGHHLVRAAGSGQGQYGEGMGDVMSVLMLDSPLLGVGFFLDCNGALRNAVNTLQYPCSGTHSCAGLLSGSVWDTRNKLVESEPNDYLDILSNLAINAMLLHTGSSIAPEITIDYLTLDDDDANISNGTPHYDEIASGFGSHNLDAPPILSGLGLSPEIGLDAAGRAGGPFDANSVTYTLENLDGEELPYRILVDEPWLDVTDGAGTLAPGESRTVTVALNATAASLASGVHRARILVENESGDDGDRLFDALLTIDRVGLGAADIPVSIPKFQTASSLIEVTETGCVGDVDVAVDISGESQSSLTVTLLSPAGTSVRLHTPGGSGASLVKSYDEEGGTPADGPGALSDLYFGEAQGTWTLSVTNGSFAELATIHDWNLDLQLLGATCPPQADPLQVTLPSLVTSDVVLTAVSPLSNPLDWIVTALPQHGWLADPVSGPIDSVPHTLAGGGNVVRYTPINGYTGDDRFRYRANDGLDSLEARVDLTVGLHQEFALFALDVDPGWATTGGWAFGTPSGGGSHGGDPVSGFTGSGVYGYNLGGDYDDAMGEETLTSTAIDCSQHVDVELSFRRWLAVEGSAFDTAELQVSTDGADWRTVWANDRDGTEDGGWTLVEYDLGAWADREPQLFLRWVMGGTDGTLTYPGWNLDDIALRGVPAPPAIDLFVEPGALSWNALPGTTSYDVVRGDLGLLRSSGGDFSAAIERCDADAAGATTLTIVDDPDPSFGFFYLVRGDAGAPVRSYDSFAPSQQGGRDAEIDASAAACP